MSPYPSRSESGPGYASGRGEVGAASAGGSDELSRLTVASASAGAGVSEAGAASAVGSLGASTIGAAMATVSCAGASATATPAGTPSGAPAVGGIPGPYAGLDSPSGLRGRSSLRPER